MKNNVTVWGYIDQRIASLKDERRIGTARNYAKTKCRLMAYCGKGNLGFEEITEEFVAGFNAYLKKAEVQNSTISFYNRVLRSVYNQASREGLVKNMHPFDEAYTKVVARLSPITSSTVRTEDGKVMELEELSRDELVRRFRMLQHRYNKLVTRVTNLARM